MLNHKKFIIILFLTILCYVLNYSKISLIVLSQIGIYNLIVTVNSQLFKDKSYGLISFKSECSCRNNDFILVEKNDKVYNIKNRNNNIMYSLTKTEFEKLHFTCDLYKTLKRGKSQKVIGYSLYGTDPLYYNYLKRLSNEIKAKYKDWIMRVYYDSTVNKSVICELDCLKDEQGNLLDNVDFCNVESLPIKNSYRQDWSLAYLHAMMWRWLPIGDSFVDVFSSRDSDSLIIQREIDSVNVWLASSKTVHIMRGMI